MRNEVQRTAAADSPPDIERLRSSAGSGPVLIVTHDNPDPDALASGKALATLLARAWAIPSRLVYSGLVARAENRMVLAHLTPEWQHVEELAEFDRYSAVAIVDTQPGAGNHRLPEAQHPQIVIDHHLPLRESLRKVAFADVRPEVGATVTILHAYLQAAGVEPDALLATAMFYGLKTDTRGLSRGVSPEDEAVYLQLLHHMDRGELVRVEQAGLSREYFRAFSRGMQAARLYGRSIIARLGQVERPDLPAEMADLLIRLEDARGVLCLGVHADTLYISLRTRPLTEDAGQLIQRVVAPPGKAGGHRSIAGGQVPLMARRPEAVAADVERRFLDVMGENDDGVALLAE